MPERSQRAALDVVTGAFSYTGRHIAEALIARGRRVRTLTRQPHPSHPLWGKVEAAPLVFDRALVEILSGADTLYNTYWVRFERGSATFARAAANTALLVDAARRAGVQDRPRRVSTPARARPFRTSEGRPRRGGRPRVGPVLRDRPPDARLRYGRPALNNIAWGLRHVPLFLVAAMGSMRCSRSRFATLPRSASKRVPEMKTSCSTRRDPCAGRSRSSYGSSPARSAAERR
jgi:NADH dehydrogenase